MKKPTKKSTKRKSSKKKISSRRNPQIGTRGDGFAFQGARYHLSNAIRLDEKSLLGNEYEPFESLGIALQYIFEKNPKDLSLEKYKHELLTPRVIKAGEEFAKLLRQQLITTSFRAGINSDTGNLIVDEKFLGRKR